MDNKFGTEEVYPPQRKSQVSTQPRKLSSVLTLMSLLAFVAGLVQAIGIGFASNIMRHQITSKNQLISIPTFYVFGGIALAVGGVFVHLVATHVFNYKRGVAVSSAQHRMLIWSALLGAGGTIPLLAAYLITDSTVTNYLETLPLIWLVLLAVCVPYFAPKLIRIPFQQVRLPVFLATVATLMVVATDHENWDWLKLIGLLVFWQGITLAISIFEADKLVDALGLFRMLAWRFFYLSIINVGLVAVFVKFSGFVSEGEYITSLMQTLSDKTPLLVIIASMACSYIFFLSLFEALRLIDSMSEVEGYTSEERGNAFGLLWTVITASQLCLGGFLLFCANQIQRGIVGDPPTNIQIAIRLLAGVMALIAFPIMRKAIKSPS